MGGIDVLIAGGTGVGDLSVLLPPGEQAVPRCMWAFPSSSRFEARHVADGCGEQQRIALALADRAPSWPWRMTRQSVAR